MRFPQTIQQPLERSIGNACKQSTFQSSSMGKMIRGRKAATAQRPPSERVVPVADSSLAADEGTTRLCPFEASLEHWLELCDRINANPTRSELVAKVKELAAAAAIDPRTVGSIAWFHAFMARSGKLEEKDIGRISICVSAPVQPSSISAASTASPRRGAPGGAATAAVIHPKRSAANAVPALLPPALMELDKAAVDALWHPPTSKVALLLTGHEWLERLKGIPDEESSEEEEDDRYDCTQPSARPRNGGAVAGAGKPRRVVKAVTAAATVTAASTPPTATSGRKRARHVVAAIESATDHHAHTANRAHRRRVADGDE